MRPAMKEILDAMIRQNVVVERPGGWLETSSPFRARWVANSRKHPPFVALCGAVGSYCDTDDAMKAWIIQMLIELLRRENRTAAERIDREKEIYRIAGIDWGAAP